MPYEKNIREPETSDDSKSLTEQIEDNSIKIEDKLKYISRKLEESSIRMEEKLIENSMMLEEMLKDRVVEENEKFEDEMYKTDVFNLMENPHGITSTVSLRQQQECNVALTLTLALCGDATDISQTLSSQE